MFNSIILIDLNSHKGATFFNIKLKIPVLGISENGLINFYLMASFETGSFDNKYNQIEFPCRIKRFLETANVSLFNFILATAIIFKNLNFLTARTSSRAFLNYFQVPNPKLSIK